MPGNQTDPSSVSPPPGWRATERPLRVAILGWARLSLQGAQGSGYNLSASDLASGLAMSGHRVSYLSSGRRYNLWPRMHVRPAEYWRGIACFDLVNSPNLSPAAHNFRNMARERSSPDQTRLVLSWLRGIDAQLIHIHSLEGFGLDLIAAVRASGRPVIVTPHNYWYGCPQVDLMRGETHLCADYDGGRACVGCLKSPPPGLTIAKRRLGHALEAVCGQAVAHMLRHTGKAAVERVREVLQGDREEVPNQREPDPEAALGFDEGSSNGHDGLIRHNFPAPTANRPERVKELGSSPPDENERFLSSDRHLVVLNEYGERRRAGIESLNAATLVTPPSDFVRSAYVAMGLKPERTRVVRLGQAHFDQINRKARRSPFYNDRPWNPATATRPLRFAYLGTMRPSKGLDVLARAIPMLPVEVRRRCVFHIRAQGWDWPYRRRLSAFPEVSFLGGYDLLQLIAASGEYDIGVVPHVWFENSPLVLLEHLHAGKFVICSRLGGPVEWLVPHGDGAGGGTAGFNGLPFAAGHADQLAACIARCVRGEVPVPSPREVHDCTPNLQSFPGHVAEVEAIYAEVLGATTPTPLPAVAVRRGIAPQPRPAAV